MDSPRPPIHRFKFLTCALHCPSEAQPQSTPATTSGCTLCRHRRPWGIGGNSPLREISPIRVQILGSPAKLRLQKREYLHNLLHVKDSPDQPCERSGSGEIPGKPPLEHKITHAHSPRMIGTPKIDAISRPQDPSTPEMPADAKRSRAIRAAAVSPSRSPPPNSPSSDRGSPPL